MDIQVKGNVELKFDVNVLECIEEIYKKLKFNENYFIRDNKLYECVDVGHHKSDYEDFLRSEDIHKIELFNACKILYEHFKNISE